MIAPVLNNMRETEIWLENEVRDNIYRIGYMILFTLRFLTWTGLWCGQLG